MHVFIDFIPIWVHKDVFYSYINKLPVILKLLTFLFKKYKNPVDSKTLKVILDDNITPIASEIGLKWNGKGMWIGSSENGIKKIISHRVGKGLMGTLAWGMCYDFLPIVSGKRVIFQRTFKSAGLQLFQSSVNDDNFSRDKSDLENGVTSTWGEKECRKSVSKLILKRKNEIFNWLENGKTLDGSIHIALEQMEDENYNLHWPNPKYVASFLYAKKGLKKKGIEMLMEVDKERLNHEREILEKLKKRLTDL